MWRMNPARAQALTVSSVTRSRALACWGVLNPPSSSYEVSPVTGSRPYAFALAGEDLAADAFGECAGDQQATPPVAAHVRGAGRQPAGFASLRWGEVTGLRRCDIDTEAGTVRVRGAYVELSNGQMILGPPKSRTGLRTVSIPAGILPQLITHLAKHTVPESDALVFTGRRGGPLRRSGWNKATGWPHAVASIGAEALHFHDLRHTGNTLAVDMGVSLKSLMVRMGHDNERAALMYQHKSAAVDRKIGDGLDKLLQAEKDQGDDGDGEAGALVPTA